MFGLFLTNISFANSSNDGIDLRTTGEKISQIDELQTPLIQEVDTSLMENEQNVAVEDIGECCGTCKITINLLIFSFSYEWCCVSCEESTPESVD
ncbi:MAG: hypothetical protein HC817_13495 [Saprospiraceae bacterium]|nr:hypothetical protein [Saprospiraceae bacterium]